MEWHRTWDVYSQHKVNDPVSTKITATHLCRLSWIVVVHQLCAGSQNTTQDKNTLGSLFVVLQQQQGPLCLKEDLWVFAHEKKELIMLAVVMSAAGKHPLSYSLLEGDLLYSLCLLYVFYQIPCCNLLPATSPSRLKTVVYWVALLILYLPYPFKISIQFQYAHEIWLFQI